MTAKHETLSLADLISMNSKGESTDPNKKDNKNTSLRNNQTILVRKYLTENYDYRYNTITDSPEWKIKQDNTFTRLNDYKLNSIAFELESNGSFMPVDKIFRLLKSDFVPLVNPIENYFDSLKGGNTSNQMIAKLAKTVKVENQDLFEKHLTKWLVGTVANSLTKEGCQNHTCLVLTGQQGVFKTTWLNNLCPPSLKEYIYTGKINVESNDTQGMLAEFFIINIDDQLRNLNRKDENALKTLITLDSVKIRKPYDRLITKRPRLASFCGSINGNDFLTDPSGSRRFLPFEALGINIEEAKKIEIDLVWAEAYHLFKTDYQYWFSQGDMAELQNNNESFSVNETGYELLIELYKPTSKNDKEAEFLQSSVIQSSLEKHYGKMLNSRKLGNALKKGGFERMSKKENGVSRYVYIVKSIQNEVVVS
ncbi:VapE domain-containing protein [Flectobacillus major]|uniref:VapE domain-containing protein n=1 Tax=Flectobacillus major TaxID=103 RepID=UPI00042A8176|nr:VapE domain-containing protein [Flectobacillus major]